MAEEETEAGAGEKSVKKEGAFASSLKRNFKQIRSDRAEAIVESAELIYKRTIEDFDVEMKQLVRDRENMLDMSPDNVQSLKVASDFNAKAFVDKDVEIALKIRNLSIKIDLTKKRYANLFGTGE